MALAVHASSRPPLTLGDSSNSSSSNSGSSTSTSPLPAGAATSWSLVSGRCADVDVPEDVISPLSRLQIDRASGHRRTGSAPSRTRHRRASSLRAGINFAGVPFPTLEQSHEEESTMAPLPRTRLEVVTPRSASVSSGSRSAMMRPRHQKATSGTGSLDLSKSRLENEGLGAYTSLESNDLCSPVHQRTASSVSQHSFASEAGVRLGSPAVFVHPMRQTPQSFTHTLTRLHSNNASDGPSKEDELHEFSPELTNTTLYQPSVISPVPRRPSTTVASLASSTTSQTNLRLASPVDSPNSQEIFSPVETPLTGRSSFDSTMFGSKKPHNPSDPEEFAAEVQRLRREYLEKQRAKDEKLAAKETKAREKQLRKEERRERRSMSRRASKQTEVMSSDGETEAEGSGPETSDFPLFVQRHEIDPAPQYEYEHTEVILTETTNASISTPPEFKGPPIKRVRRKASNTWGKLKFDATTVRIHVMRSMGLRARD